MLTSILVMAVGALPGPVAEPFSVRTAQQRFVELDGVLYARQGGWSVSVDLRGVVAFTGSQRVAFEVVEVRRDGAACATVAQWRAADGVVAKVARACGLSETWATRDEGVEHALVLERAPAGRGALRVKVATQGAWHHADAQGHVFLGPGGGEPLRYGNAFVVRGGAKLPIAVEHVEGALELVVPAELVDAPGAFPLHLDPLVSGKQWLEFTARPLALDTSNEKQPALAWSPTTEEVLVAWVDERRVGQSDLFGASLDSEGKVQQQNFPLVVEPGNQRKPALAWDPENARFILAWEHDTGVAWAAVDGAYQVVMLGARGGARAPTLTTLPDAAVGLAFGEGNAARLGTVDFPAVWSFPVSGSVEATALAAEGASWALAVHALDAGASGVWLFLEDGGASPSRMCVGTCSDPDVEFGAGRLWLSFRSGGDVVVEERGAGAIGTPHADIPGSKPQLVRLGSTVWQGFVSDVGISWRVLNGANNLPTITLARPPESWAVTEVNGEAFIAWASGGLLSTDVRAAPLSSLATAAPPDPLGYSVAQREPRVALRDGRGWAVWRNSVREVRGAVVKLDPSGPTPVVGLAFEVFTASATLFQPLRVVQVDVARGDQDQALVAIGVVGSLGATIRTVLLDAADTPTLHGLETPVPPNTAATFVGPVVAWRGSDYVVAWSNGTTLSVQSVMSDGGKNTSELSNLTRNITQLEIDCVEGRCFATWTSSDGTYGLDLAKSTPVAHPYGDLSLSNDGERPCVAWRSDGGFSVGCVDDAGALLSVGHISWNGQARGEPCLSQGRPPVLTWSDGTFLWTARPGELPTKVGKGLTPHVATEVDGDDARGVLVASDYGADFGLRAFATGLVWHDAGLSDGGADAGLDAGSDAGLSDADGGSDAGPDAGAGDAGITRVDFTTSGCEGCTSGPTALWVASVLLLVVRRRRA